MTRPLVIINSGAYVDQELAAEFGQLPPAFLPVGVTRLYEFQLDSLGDPDGQTYLTIPQSFEIPEWDVARLDSRNTTVLRTPDDMDIGGALLQALARIGISDRPLRLLHGDTLINDLDLGIDDAVAVTLIEDGYRWGAVKRDGGSITQVSPPSRSGEAAEGDFRLGGYYSFSSAAAFAEAIIVSRGDFFAALNAYAKLRGLAATIVNSWLDFGHTQTFFRSRRMITTSRAFNTLAITETTVCKRSAQKVKLKAEAHWLRAIPVELQPYTARLLDEGEEENSFWYTTEYEHLPTLAELYVFSRLPRAPWRKILDSCIRFLELTTVAVPSHGAFEPVLPGLVITKARQRLSHFAQMADLDVQAPNRVNGRNAPSLNACIDLLSTIIADLEPVHSVMHGDFCFSNILYNFRSERVRVVDPRGVLEDGATSLFGDMRYDAAKLMHSIQGRYDAIIAGRYVCQQEAPNSFAIHFPTDPDSEWLNAEARGLSAAGVRLDDAGVAAAVVCLFLSMPPLHADRPDRQTAFIANALRLFLELDQ